MTIFDPVPPANFYANNSTAAKKRMSSPVSETDGSSRSQQVKKKKSLGHSRDLYSNLGKSNLHERRESEDQKRLDLYGGVEPDRYLPKGNIKSKMKPKPRRPMI